MDKKFKALLKTSTKKTRTKSLKKKTKPIRLTRRRRSSLVRKRENMKLLANEQKKQEIESKLIFDDIPFTKEHLTLLYNTIVIEEPQMISLPTHIDEILFPYQRDGIQFLLSNATKGGILAHTMGLGKTLQIIVFLYLLSAEKTKDCKKIMIIAPLTLINNWISEFRKWKNRLQLNYNTVYVYHFSENPQLMLSNWLEFGGILLMHYQGLTNLTIFEPASGSQNQKDTDWPSNLRPDVLICDEGHLLKNSNSNMSFALDIIPCAAKFILTGTPIQNNLMEFFTLVNLIRPGLLGTSAWFEKFFINTTESNELSRMSLLKHLTSYVMNQKDLQQISHLLPPRLEYTIYIEYSSQQQIAYQECLNNTRNIHYKTPQGIPYNPDIFNLINQNEIIGAIGSGIDSFNLENCIKNSYKMRFILEIIQASQRCGDKVVVFTKLTNFSLNSISKVLAFYQIKHEIITGDTPVDRRQTICEEFGAAEHSVLLLSIKVGGYGLNIVAANRVIMFDIPWNPADTQQAMFRVYRHGQTKPTFIYQLVATGTIEEVLYKRQLEKRKMAQNLTSADLQTIDPKLLFADLKYLNFMQLPLPKSEIAVEIKDDDLLVKVLKEFPKGIQKIEKNDITIPETAEIFDNTANRFNLWLTEMNQ